ncbi:hypothetical protein GALL_431720 [mine drainage metagenome]|uniref:Uncharacterized protein n=1 Tax=mine drainage metagenome TaxID=410659 RepID=A0A1J5QGQ7_9ZZZZ
MASMPCGQLGGRHGARDSVALPAVRAKYGCGFDHPCVFQALDGHRRLEGMRKPGQVQDELQGPLGLAQGTAHQSLVDLDFIEGVLIHPQQGAVP